MLVLKGKEKPVLKAKGNSMFSKSFEGAAWLVGQCCAFGNRQTHHRKYFFLLNLILNP